MNDMETKKVVYSFQAESEKLLDLMTNSLYSNKEIFLRELISNASDAIERLKFIALHDTCLFENDIDLHVCVEFDKEQRTITVTDNGIGMSLDEAITNLGTIAKSGTTEFTDKLKINDTVESNTIGKFGVGFYSSFIVAKKIVVKSRKAGLAKECGVEWSSVGTSIFDVRTIEKKERGTIIILYLKDNEDEYLNYWKLRSIATKYSDHITIPIIMKQDTTTGNTEIVNNASALWTLPKTDITKKQYCDLYKNISNDFDDPLLWLHNKVEGNFQYINLLYIPSKLSAETWSADKVPGIKLYVRRVFIMSGVKTFLPNYLRFVCGIIDSADLKVNISRELLQEDNTVRKIKTSIINKLLNKFEELLLKERDTYNVFWDNFGVILKEGISEDFLNKERVSKLLCFTVSYGSNLLRNITLKEYITKMIEHQTKIYYVTAETTDAALNNPQIELFKSKNVPVLILTDRIDEWLVVNLSEFSGHKLQSIVKDGIDNTILDSKQLGNIDEEINYKNVLMHVKEVLKEQVRDVRLTKRLLTSPSCVVLDTFDMSLQMTKIMKSAGQNVKKVKPILELNTENVIVQHLLQESDNTRFSCLSFILLEQALLAEGGQLTDPATFVKNTNTFLTFALTRV